MTDSPIPSSRRHLWLRGPEHARPPAVAALELPVLAEVDAHRRRRGPYSAAGSVARSLYPEALRQDPELVARHDIELPAVAPELASAIAGTRETLTSSSSPQERTRYYPRARTTRLAHGLTEFVAEFLDVADRGPCCLVVHNLEEADPTDAEWLTIMLRRTDPARLRLVVTTEGDELWGDLVTTLGRFAEEYELAPTGGPAETPEDDAERARRYVASDCTSRDPALRRAYEARDPAGRAALHDARAAEVAGRDEASLGLGALPFHLERGSDPAGAGARALEAALEHCVLQGFYDAVVELGRRCLDLLSWEEEPERCWMVVAKMATAHSVLDRPDDAAALYDEACAASTLPSIHLQSAYGRAMLFTRFYEPERRDHLQAKAWINTAIAIASLYPERERRAYNLTFHENGLALVEMHLGDLQRSLTLVTDGLERLERELAPEREALHRSVLLYNAAQLLTRMAPPEEALRAYGEVIAADPNHSEYYFERAGLYRRTGRVAEALADYAEAMRLSPPYPEPYYNRGDLRLELGDLTGALADFSYVIELDPSFVGAYANRAALLYELGEWEAAAADVRIGLALDPAQASLHCTRGLLAQESGDFATAREAYDTALRLQPGLVGALGNRAILAFEAGDVDGAIADLSEALELSDDGNLRANRGFANQTAGRWGAAIADYDAALEHDGVDRAEVLFRRGECRERAGMPDLARDDFRRCAELQDPEYSERAAAALGRLAPALAGR